MHSFPVTSQHRAAEPMARVTACSLFIGMEGTPEHCATSLVPEIPGTGFPVGMLQGGLGTPRNLGLPLCDSAVFI